jgi:plastocyanin
MKQRSLIVIALVSLSLILFAACRETPEQKKETWMGTSTDTSGTAAATDSATHPGSPGGAALVPDVTSGTTMIVVLEDNSIGVQGQTIPPGPAVLTVTNRGSDVHNLFIEGEGISRAAGDAIPEGGTSTVDVTFKAGTYTLYCPIGDHRTNGEEVKITINSPTAPTGTTTGASTTASPTVGSANNATPNTGT